jgi:hypothetical protein
MKSYKELFEFLETHFKDHAYEFINNDYKYWLNGFSTNINSIKTFLNNHFGDYNAKILVVEDIYKYHGITYDALISKVKNPVNIIIESFIEDNDFKNYYTITTPIKEFADLDKCLIPLKNNFVVGIDIYNLYDNVLASRVWFEDVISDTYDVDDDIILRIVCTQSKDTNIEIFDYSNLVKSAIKI